MVATIGSQFHRQAQVPVSALKGTLPDVHISDDVDHASVATQYIPQIASLNINLLTETALWRDLWALTGTGRTFYGAQQIHAVWSELSQKHKAHNFSIVPGSSSINNIVGEHQWIRASFTFDTEGTPAETCSGFVGLIPVSNGTWKIWSLSTILEQIRGFPSCDTLEPSKPPHSTNGFRKPAEPSRVDCVVVGAGMSGLSVAGRLQALGVSYVVLEKNEQVGDNWTNRYDSAKRKF